MTEADAVRAVCCLAGADGEVTVEELQLLGNLAAHAGLEMKPFHGLIEKTREDEDFRVEQTEVATRDPDATMRALIRCVRQDDAIDEGHAMMLLWRVATTLGMEADRFEALLGEEAQGSGR